MRMVGVCASVSSERVSEVWGMFVGKSCTVFEKGKHFTSSWLPQGETVVYAGHEGVFSPEFNKICPLILPKQVFHSQLGGREGDDPSCPPGILPDSICLGVKSQRNFLDFFLHPGVVKLLVLCQSFWGSSWSRGLFMFTVHSQLVLNGETINLFASRINFQTLLIYLLSHFNLTNSFKQQVNQWLNQYILVQVLRPIIIYYGNMQKC